MAIDFPANPTNGQVYANYIYDSSITAWRNVNTDTGIGTLNAMGLKNVVPSSVTVGSGSSSTNSNGLVTFSAVSTISLNGVFTSTYNNYRIMLRCGNGTLGAATYFRLRSAGSDRTNANYYYGGYMSRETGASLTAWSGNGASVFDINRIWSGDQGTTTAMDVFNPVDATKATGFSAASWSNDNSGGFGNALQGLHSINNTNDGFSLNVSSGVISGTISVYGYTN